VPVELGVVAAGHPALRAAPEPVVQALSGHAVTLGDLGRGPSPLDHFLHRVVSASAASASSEDPRLRVRVEVARNSPRPSGSCSLAARTSLRHAPRVGLWSHDDPGLRFRRRRPRYSAHEGCPHPFSAARSHRRGKCGFQWLDSRAVQPKAAEDGAGG
jgi:hypothetical protein